MLTHQSSQAPEWCPYSTIIDIDISTIFVNKYSLHNFISCSKISGIVRFRIIPRPVRL